MANRFLMLIIPITLVFLASCATQRTMPSVSPPEENTNLPESSNTEDANPFTDEAILQVNEGMSSSEIQELFGPPNGVSSKYCLDTACRVWKYIQRKSKTNASFIFKDQNGIWILDEFDIQKF